MHAATRGLHSWSAVVGLAAVVLTTTSLRAQELVVAVTGEVRDVSTNAPIPGAIVALPSADRAVLTDEEGRFRFRIPSGTYEWVISRLGYVPVRQESVVIDGDHFRIGLMPSPIELEPVVVDVETIDETLAYRRSAAAVSIQPISPVELTRSGAANLEEFLKSRLGLVLCPISGLAANPAAGAMTNSLAASLAGFQGCIYSRGRVLPVAVYINDNYALGGILELATYSPHEVYTIEMWRRGTEIRVFTNDYIQRVSRGREVLHSTPLPPPGG